MKRVSLEVFTEGRRTRVVLLADATLYSFALLVCESLVA